MAELPPPNRLRRIAPKELEAELLEPPTQTHNGKRDLRNIEAVGDFDSLHVEGADFTGSDFRGSRLSGARLIRCVLREVNFAGVDLRGAHLTDSELPLAVFDGADVENGDLADTNLHGVSARRANLKGVRAANARINQAHFDGANCARADFTSAQIVGSSFRQADLTYTLFRVAELRHVSFGKAVLRGTKFYDAVLWDIRLGFLDEAATKGARWGGGGWLGFLAPPWRQLRVAYSGTRTLFHLLFLIAFLSPFVARAAYWVGVNRGQTAVQNLEARLGGVGVAGAPNPAGVRRLPELTPCLAPTCRETRVWRTVLRVDGGLTAWLPVVALLLYNAIRLILTWKIGPLRDDEDLSGHSPPLLAYRRLVWLHFAFSLLFVYVVIHAVIVLGDVLNRPVWIPT